MKQTTNYSDSGNPLARLAPRKFLRGLLMAATVAGAPASYAGKLPVVVMEKDKTMKVAKIEDSQFTQAVADVISSLTKSTHKVLREQPAKAPEGDWFLRNVIVGVGLNFSAGFGPILKVSAAPRVRLCFSNSTQPRMPD